MNYNHLVCYIPLINPKRSSSELCVKPGAIEPSMAQSPGLVPSGSEDELVGVPRIVM